MKISFFGSSLVSAYWNGAATYYRGIISALYQKGHKVTFYEPDALSRQQHRDIADPLWGKVVVYPADSENDVLAVLDRASHCDLLIKASGVGVFDRLLEEAVLDYQSDDTLVAFWDVDAPATLDRMEANPYDRFRDLVPWYDVVFTYGGGNPVVEAYRWFGARLCVPIYNALDPSSHFPVAPEPRFHADLGFLGNRLPDREARADEFFFRAASECLGHSFLLGGSGWGDKPRPANVTWLDHVFTASHNAFNCSARAVLNISRDSMARYGFSPATRVFEAAGAGACIITDQWEGIEQFLEPGREILVAANGDEVTALLRSLTIERAQAIGKAARRRVLSEHTYSHRADLVEQVLSALRGERQLTGALG